MLGLLECVACTEVGVDGAGDCERGEAVCGGPFAQAFVGSWDAEIFGAETTEDLLILCCRLSGFQRGKDKKNSRILSENIFG